MAAILNEISIKNKINTTAKKQQFVGLVRSAANTRFIFAKTDLLKDFDNHIVTKELLQNPAEAGSALIDHGNLVSFLGLQDGKEEVGIIREALEFGITMDKTPKITSDKNKIYYSFKINLPTKAKLNELTPTPDNWSSRSIIEIIEHGVGNAAYYVFRVLGLPNSRSGHGLQIETKRKSGGSFRPMKYISELFEKFRQKFN